MVSLRTRLEELEQQLSLFPDPKEPPPTILQVVGRGSQEQDWQRLLFHYLSPDEAHGLNHELLREVLVALSDRDDVDYSFSRLDLKNVQIKQEVTTNHGRPDAVIWSPEEWFICWELKVMSAEGEGQTPGYVAADTFSGIDINKSNDQIDSCYLYLAPADAQPPEADEFTAISWDWIRSVIQSFLTESHGEYPARTVAQLQEFTGTIRTELSMTEYQENQRDKAKLYYEYYDEVTELEAAFNEQWQTLINTWGTQLAQTLRTVNVVEDSELADQFVVVDVAGSGTDQDRWLFREGSNWGLLRRNMWWRSTEDLSPIYSVPEDNSIAALGLFHRLNANRELAVENRTLELQFWHKNENSDEFVRRFNQCLMEKEAEIREGLPSTVRFPEITETKRKLWRAHYNIHTDDYDDFFRAYVGTLNEAFVDLVIDQPKLFTSINQAFDEALGLYR